MRPVAWQWVTAAFVILCGLGGLQFWSLNSHMRTLQADMNDMRASVTRDVDRAHETLIGERASEAASKELRAAMNKPAEGAGAAVPVVEEAIAPIEAPVEAPSPEQAAKIDEGKRLIDAAMMSGHWSENEQTKIREILHAIPQREARNLKLRIVVAINEQKIRPELPPF